MIPKPFLKKTIVLPIAGCLFVSLIAWQELPKPALPPMPASPVNVSIPAPPANLDIPQMPALPALTDTIPAPKAINRDRKIADLDDVLDELENSRQQLEAQMKQFDAKKMQEQITQAMKSIDVEKMQADIKKAMANIDVQKLKLETEKSLAAVDWDKLDQEMKKVKEIDMKELEKNMEKVKAEMKDLQPKIEKEMAKAKKDLEKAKAEMQEYKRFLNDLEADGLLRKDENYTIENRNGELIINQQKQPAAVYNKYKQFLQKHSPFTLQKDDNGFNINKD